MTIPLDQTFTVIGIDQSLTGTGLAVVTANYPTLEVVTTKIISSKLAGVQRLEEILLGIRTMVAMHKPDVVAMEDYTRMASSASLSALIELAGCIKLELSRMGLEPVVQNQSSMKKFSFGEGNTKKDSQYMLKVFDATGLRFDDDNAADAYLHAALLATKIWVLRGQFEFSHLPSKQRDTLLSMAQKASKKTDSVFRKSTDDEKFAWFKEACRVT
jgi:Holliday junction resolvasome RuvABC endonuclease subunit